MKKLIWIVVCLALLLSLGGCGAREESGAAPAGSVAAPLNASGRYTERELALPMPEGLSAQYVAGIFRAGESVCVIAYGATGSDEASFACHYYRHSFAADGAVTSASEPWLDVCAPQGGNDLHVLAGDDGRLYASFSDYDEKMNSVAHIFVSEDGGATGRELAGDVAATLPNLTSLGVLADGSIAALNFYGNAAVLLDAQGSYLEDLDVQASYAAGCAARGSYIAAPAPGTKAVRLLDRANGGYKDFEYRFNEDSYGQLALSAEGNLYLADATGLYRHTPDGTLWECLMEGASCTLGLPGVYPGVLYADAGTPYDTLYLAAEGRVYEYAFDASAAAAAERELTVFSLEANETVRQALVIFAREHSDVKVTYKIAMDGETAGTAQDYIKALNTELLAGTGPDILILDGLPLDSYIEKDVLLELGAIADGAEPMLSNLRAALETDGKLYAAPTGFLLPLAAGDADTAQTFASLAALADAAEAAGETPLLSRCAFSYETLASYLLKYYGDALASGDAADVAAFLRDAKRISEATGCTAELGRGWSALQDMTPGDLRELMLSWGAGPQMVTALGGASLAVLSQPYGGFAQMMELCGGADRLGLTLAGVNGQFVPVGLAGVNKASAESETAALFVQTLLSHAAQSGNDFASQFPANAQALEEALAYENRGTSTGFHLDDGTEVSYYWPSAERRAQVGAVIETLTTPLREDAALREMLLPELTACLAGELTEAAAAQSILSHLATYLAE